MGCVFSKHFRKSKQRSFNVWNVDDHGNHLSYGRIEITQNDLLLHQPRGQGTVYWPLRSLRRYGFDSELFSFECGRRCPTGPGIYAFKCRQAETLFNVLQECIQNTSNPYNNNNESRVQSLSVLDEQSSITVNMLSPIIPPSDSSYLEPRHSDPAVMSTHTSTSSRRSSAATPTTIFTSRHSLPDPQVHQYVNTNVDKYMNGLACVDLNTNYARLDELLKQERFYVNVTPDTKERLYENVLEGCSPSPCMVADDNPQGSDEPTAAIEPGSPQVNYVQLDLDQHLVPHVMPTSLQELNTVVGSTPGSPQVGQGYATIDFARTAALSNSTNATADEDQSVRKTRHNSTIA